ncbi:MAG: divergent polysaccharide deacetylase family protein [Alphaproteobacteria bacterium]|nr:divergent polysaccharide deacetylase family protein [Alphaproteobacteria bacterium]
MAKPRLTLPFSSRAFTHGMLVGVSSMVLLAGWMGFQADQTALRQSEKLASKTALIDRQGSHIIVRNLEDAPSESALPSAPIAGLFEETPQGKIPLARQEDGLTPFDAYKRPFTPTPDKKPVALVFYDVGVSATQTQAVFNDFPEDVTLSLVPDLTNAADISAQARRKGHEVWLSLPIQTDQFPQTDLGPQTILKNAAPSQIKERLFTSLGKISGYTGIITPPDHVFLESDTAFMPWTSEIFGRGLAIVDSRQDRPFFATALAQKNDYPYAQAQVYLSPDMPPQDIKQALAEAERMALSGTGVIILSAPAPLHLKYLKAWVGMMGNKPLQLAPLSALMTVTPPAETTVPSPSPDVTQTSAPTSVPVPETPAPVTP